MHIPNAFPRCLHIIYNPQSRPTQLIIANYKGNTPLGVSMMTVTTIQGGAVSSLSLAKIKKLPISIHSIHYLNYPFNHPKKLPRRKKKTATLIFFSPLLLRFHYPLISIEVFFTFPLLHDTICTRIASIEDRNTWMYTRIYTTASYYR